MGTASSTWPWADQSLPPANILSLTVYNNCSHWSLFYSKSSHWLLFYSKSSHWLLFYSKSSHWLLFYSKSSHWLLISVLLVVILQYIFSLDVYNQSSRGW